MMFQLLFILASLGSVAPELLGGQIPTQKSDPLPVCLDDSDCVQHGDKYACFKYFCYPWKDDSDISEPHRRQLCREEDECSDGQTCFRHHDKRAINRGLCLDNVLLEKCELESDCGPNYGCCGGLCCEVEYHSRFTELPCVSDLGCMDLGLGTHCCPRPNSSSICCEPTPSTTPVPIQSPATGSASATSYQYRLCLLLPLLGRSLISPLL